MTYYNRCKILRVPRRDIFNLIYVDDIECTIIKKLDIPIDVKVVEIYNDPQYQAFVFILKSDEYEPIPEGEELPILEWGENWLRSVVLKPIEGD